MLGRKEKKRKRLQKTFMAEIQRSVLNYFLYAFGFLIMLIGFKYLTYNTALSAKCH